MISIIRSALAANPEARATLVYGNRTTSSIMFRRALEELKDRHLGRLAVFHVLSRESQEIDILNGRIDGERIALLRRTIVPPKDVDGYFLCGPFGMIEEGRAALIAAGVEPQRGSRRSCSRPTGAAAPRPPRAAAIAFHEGAGPGRLRPRGPHPSHRGRARGAHHRGRARTGIRDPPFLQGRHVLHLPLQGGRGRSRDGHQLFARSRGSSRPAMSLACQSRPLTKGVKLDFDAV